MVKIIMNGCNGHMGQVISRIVEQDAEAEIVAVLISLIIGRIVIRYLRISKRAMQRRMY